MKVIVRDSATRDLEDIFTWISKENPRAAMNMVERIRLRINRLAHPGLSHVGRPGLVSGTRELVEPPYIVIYEVNETAGEVVVLAVMHGARDREER
ncbi:MAG: type II toxin-antitoxin system RelE/ParE family toxin [Pseudolabrys sp.]|jgi:plasmid stabilization system protein ParE|nr:type II toxin-antitoxin system RelE/ParE family toxin [Pseudolabrys sp.]